MIFYTRKNVMGYLVDVMGYKCQDLDIEFLATLTDMAIKHDQEWSWISLIPTLDEYIADPVGCLEWI